MITAGDVISSLNDRFITYLNKDSVQVSETYNLCLTNNIDKIKKKLNEEAKVELFYEFETEDKEHAKTLFNDTYSMLDIPGRDLNKIVDPDLDFSQKVYFLLHRQEKYI